MGTKMTLLAKFTWHMNSPRSLCASIADTGTSRHGDITFSFQANLGIAARNFSHVVVPRFFKPPRAGGAQALRLFVRCALHTKTLMGPRLMRHRFPRTQDSGKRAFRNAVRALSSLITRISLAGVRHQAVPTREGSGWAAELLPEPRGVTSYRVAATPPRLLRQSNMAGAWFQ